MYISLADILVFFCLFFKWQSDISCSDIICGIQEVFVSNFQAFVMCRVLAKPTTGIQHAFTGTVFWRGKLNVISQGKVPVLRFANVYSCVLFGVLLLSVRLHASTEIHDSGF